MNKKIVIAIDGPAGSGKSTISKALAEKLKVPYLSTGSLYRALAYKCIKNNMDAENSEVAEWIAKNTNVTILFKDGKQIVMLDGIDITNKLSLDEVSRNASKISVHKVIREKMLDIQRNFADKNSVIMDGRDIGSVVLPMADFKFYLDATPEVRAKRRHIDLINAGNNISYEEVLKEIKERDFRDKNRAISPLIVAKDAIIIDCSNLTIEDVLNEFLKYLNRFN